MGIFSDMELGQIIVIIVIIGLCIFFGGKNVLRDDGGSNGKGGSGGGNSGSNNSNNTPLTP